MLSPHTSVLGTGGQQRRPAAAASSGVRITTFVEVNRPGFAGGWLV
jgi:hypothetical protein